MNKDEMIELARMIAVAVVDALEHKGIIGNPNSQPREQGKTAYQKTEQLLYNYMNFKRIVDERMKEIDTIKECGAPKKSTSVVEYAPKSGTVHGLKTVEESVDCAIRSVQGTVDVTVDAIALIDKCMESMKNDPYYCILEMRYFEGRTQEDIADHLGCSQVTVSKNKGRLVKELSIKLFPNQAIEEMFR